MYRRKIKRKQVPSSSSSLFVASSTTAGKSTRLVVRWKTRQEAELEISTKRFFDQQSKPANFDDIYLVGKYCTILTQHQSNYILQ